MINNYIGNKKLIVLNQYLHILVIVLFEFFGTLIFAYCTYNMVNLKSSGKSIYLRIVYFFLDFSLSMLTPNTTKPFSVSMAWLSRRLQASLVHPGVLSLG